MAKKSKGVKWMMAVGIMERKCCENSGVSGGGNVVVEGALPKLMKKCKM